MLPQSVGPIRFITAMRSITSKRASAPVKLYIQFWFGCGYCHA
jgi:hypothetical protein